MTMWYEAEDQRLLNQRAAKAAISDEFTIIDSRGVWGIGRHGALSPQTQPAPAVSLGKQPADDYIKAVAELQEDIAQKERDRLWNLVVMAARGA